MKRLIWVVMAATFIVMMLTGNAQAHPVIRQVADFAPVRAEVTRLITPAGDLVGGKFQRWVDASHIPTIREPITITDAGMLCGGLIACSEGPPRYGPVREIGLSQRSTRFDLYFELGHQFDWLYLTAKERRYLARAWGVPQAPWWDSQTELDVGKEDGLEASFSALYADCAMGWNDQGSYLQVGDGPSIHPMVDTCKFIKSIEN